jgi:hypothetical protein
MTEEIDKSPSSKKQNLKLFIGSGNNKSTKQDAQGYNTPLQVIAAVDLWHKERLAGTHPQDSKALNPQYISPRQRRGAVAELLRRGVRGIEIAEIFGKSPACITQDKRAIMRELAKSVKDFDAKAFIGWLYEEAEWHIAVAKKDKDYRLSWQVITQLQVLLSNYGLVRPLQKVIGEDEPQKDPLEVALEKMTDNQLERIQQIMAEDDEAVNG